MFENIISKNLNADAQESAAENSEAATATTTAPVEEAIATKPAYAPATPHDDFDWSVDRRNVTSYSAEEKEKYHQVYDNTFVQLDDGQMMKGLVVGLTKTDVVLNIGFKSDGLISLNEFRDLPNLAVGDEVEVMIVEKEDRDGHLN
ncbi:MAG: 30S ribosomal protein S1, partial [Chitinophagaceae bacterium]